MRLELSSARSTRRGLPNWRRGENGCCSFFSFTLTIADGGLTLEVAVPQEQVEVLDALQARAGAASGSV
ncbi:hypothetical protein [Nonomuraea dietziae]|uniref:hypothetical protein n=1 Tax=Nonomuraea dietziae TaxID=65515 RepID=UPI0031D3560D